VVDDDLFDFNDEDEAPQEQDSNPVKQLRTHANKLEKQLKAQEKELEDLRSFHTEQTAKQRDSQVTTVFNDLGLNPAHVKFWKLENPDTEPEANAVGKWAVENGFAQAEESAPDTGSFTPTTVEGTAVGNKRLSVTEWYELTASDPAAAQLAFQKGRVDFTGIRQGLGQEK
jgi:hypothetical protein